MRKNTALFLTLLFSAFLFWQCSGGGAPEKPKQPDRTVQDVDRDLQQFKKDIRVEVRSRNRLIVVAGAGSLLLNLILAGFVLYYRKKAALLAPAPKKSPRKAPAKKAAAAGEEKSSGQS